MEMLKLVFYGDDKMPANEEDIVATIRQMISDDLIPLIVDNINILAFEAKKDFVVVFSHLMHKKIGNQHLAVEYMEQHLTVLDNLVSGYEKRPSIAKTCGHTLRLCIEHETLCKYLIYSPKFYNFFDYVSNPDFDIASDALSTFKDLLTTHKTLCATFLETNYDKIFGKYNDLLHSENYVTKRQSLKLLGELLLDRANFNVMTKYISQYSNLILMMNLLRYPSKNIQFEAFHVFKVFVANPNKAEPILDILTRNKDRLIRFLNAFHNEKANEDEQFADEKAFLLKQIELLPNK